MWEMYQNTTDAFKLWFSGGKCMSVHTRFIGLSKSFDYCNQRCLEDQKCQGFNFDTRDGFCSLTYDVSRCS